MIKRDNYKDCIHFAATQKGETVAMLSLFDPTSVKQNVLFRLPWYYSVAMFLLRVGKPLLHTPYMPHIGEAIRILYIKDFSFLPGHEDAFISLVKFVNQYAYKNNFSFLSVTLHEKDEMRARFRVFRSFTFIVHGMICSLQNNNKAVEKIKEGNIFKDFSLI